MQKKERQEVDKSRSDLGGGDKRSPNFAILNAAETERPREEFRERNFMAVFRRNL